MLKDLPTLYLYRLCTASSISFYRIYIIMIFEYRKYVICAQCLHSQWHISNYPQQYSAQIRSNIRMNPPVANIITEVSTCQLYLAIRQLIYDKSEIMKWYRCNIHFWIPLFMRRIYTVMKDCTLRIEKCHNSQFHPRSWHKGFADSSLFWMFSVIGASVINRSMKSTSNLFVS